ncbi:Ribulose bisphosphate carboxylase/oxygenase activase 1, chloroplastic [Sesamum angolense]|uniref:Ribulose bisphosphate carboxylase/oxygenase activase, chloroplastic n=1 Tax=Sesamum angolense TaxID=2727404 RepID=A0AAE1X195_9LAMI|nr:Ribulose bisphosphate carboxylase/oxygenase activase 1, chloroplastic [Sesamum angolense]
MQSCFATWQVSNLDCVANGFLIPNPQNSNLCTLFKPLLLYNSPYCTNHSPLIAAPAPAPPPQQTLTTISQPLESLTTMAAAVSTVGAVNRAPVNLNGSVGGAAVPSSSFLGMSLKKVNSSHVPKVSSGNFKVVAEVNEKKQTDQDRWKGLVEDISDDQQDITRGKGMVDSLFQAPTGMGTHDPVLSSYEYISQGLRQYNLDNTMGGLYIAPAFMDKLVVHISKNFMSLPNIKVPLILGIWGGKGQGKSFQCELVFSKMGINPIMMSAGELESGNAGEPAKLIRQRYREAADIIKKGKMCCLFINDLDAGAGRLGGTTQYTVNNQMVNATLMNIADNPTNVQLPFYWAPTREDRIGVCKGIFRTDNVPDEAVVTLVDAFPGQSIDFFGALRARVYDDEVRKWIGGVGVDNVGKKLVNSREGPPTFEQPKMTLQKLLEYGNMLVQEQENVKRVQLADKYLKDAALGDANKDAIESKAAQKVNVPVPEGCTDPNANANANATNFDPTPRSDDGSCLYK